MHGPAPTDGHPVAERLYSIQEVARLTGADPNMLRRWDRTGLLRASRRVSGRPRYDFRDLIAARTALGLLASGLRPVQVRQAVEALRSWRPDLDDPLASLRVFSEGGRLVVRMDGTLIEPVSGQTLLALPIGEMAQAARELGGRVVPVARLGTRRSAPAEPEGPEAWFEAGLAAEADEDPALAERCYTRTLELEPEHTGALLNLGNLAYAAGALAEARDLYRRATLSDPGYPEAHYNLANVLDDLGQTDAAIGAYGEALALEPELASAHFNLALVWEKVGERSRAREHWRRYLLLSPGGPSADVARSFLEDASE